jgi:glycosyltransferase involved in cell wall biosynthesis
MADHAGCGWYRIMLPLGQLREYGHETKWARKATTTDVETSDVIIGQRTCDPAPTLRWQEWAAKKNREYLMVYDLDDNLWAVDTNNPASVAFSDPTIRRNLISNVAVADLVTVSTEPLAQVVRRWNTNVVVLPNAIPSGMLSWRTGRHEDRVTVGWQGGPTHGKDWEVAAEPVARWFNQARKAGVEIEMHTVGALPDHGPRCRADCRTDHFPVIHPHRHSPWDRDIAGYYRRLDWHIALAPLAPTRFNESKSHLRALEAAMLGFPVVASNVEAYGQFVQHGRTGFLVDRPSDWGRWLGELVGDADLREDMGRAARAHAQQHTIEQTGKLWEEAYSQ